MGRAFGTFGELLQGALPPDGRDFLVTLPVARWSVAVFRSMPGRALRVLPRVNSKSRMLAARILRLHGMDPGASLRISSGLPAGKGMASSSADLVATARAIGSAFGLDTSPTAIEDLLRTIEPTDGVMYDSSVAFYHREVRLHARLGALPALTIVGIDEGGMLDTVQFNRIPKAFTNRDMHEYESLLAELTHAIKIGDAQAIGALATRSAVLNQQLQPKRLLDDAIGLCRKFGALGVVAAHSGTKLGILLADSDPDYDIKLAQLVEACEGLSAAVSIDYTLPLAHQRLES